MSKKIFFEEKKKIWGGQKFSFLGGCQKIFFYVCIDAEQLPIEKITYFRNLIICYKKKWKK